MDVRWRYEDVVFEVTDFLSAERCDQLIAYAEELGFEEALVSTERGAVRITDMRNNDRVIHDNQELADEFWSPLEPLMPAEFRGRTLVGLNERLRFYRYDPGQQFDWHQDGYYERPNGERSCFTFMIYLNDDFEGGATTFQDMYSGTSFNDFTVVPKKGNALAFFHPFMHRGDNVVSGRKYVIRTDVMYSALTG